MMEIFYFACDFLFTAVKSYITLQIVKTLSDTKWSPIVENLAEIVTVFVIASLNTYNHMLVPNALFSNNMLMLLIFIQIIICFVLYRCKKGIIAGIIFYAWVGMALFDFFIQALIYSILNDCGKMPRIFLQVGIYRGLYLIVASGIVLWAGYCIKRWLKTNIQDMNWNSKLAGILPIPMLVCMVYFQRIYKLDVSEQFMGHCWIFILGVILLLLLEQMRVIKQREEEKNYFQEQKMALLEKNYEALLKVYDEKSVLLHDIKNHMRVIQELAETDQIPELLKYVSDMKESLTNARNRTLTNHRLLDLILNVKMQEAEENHIALQYEFDDMSEMVLQPIEICALFSNLLDNAIEANQKLPSGQERWINLSCIRKNKILVISLSNAQERTTETVRHEMPETTKADKKQHGFGLQSVNRVIKAYDGYMEIEMHEGKFSIVAYLNGFDGC